MVCSITFTNHNNTTLSELYLIPTTCIARKQDITSTSPILLDPCTKTLFIPLYSFHSDLLKSLNKRDLYFTKKEGFSLGIQNLIEQALQLDFHLIKGGWKGACTLLDLSAIFFTRCGQSSSAFARYDIGRDGEGEGRKRGGRGEREEDKRRGRETG